MKKNNAKKGKAAEKRVAKKNLMQQEKLDQIVQI